AGSGMDDRPAADQHPEPLENRVDVLYGRRYVECTLERGSIDAPGDLRVATDERCEIALFVPGPHRVPLHEPVRLATVDARLDEGEQHPVREDEAVGRLEVPQHPRGMDDEPVDDPREPVEHVVER